MPGRRSSSNAPESPSTPCVSSEVAYEAAKPAPAPAPVPEVPSRPSRMIHFFNPASEKMEDLGGLDPQGKDWNAGDELPETLGAILQEIGRVKVLQDFQRTQVALTVRIQQEPGLLDRHAFADGREGVLQHPSRTTMHVHITTCDEWQLESLPRFAQRLHDAPDLFVEVGDEPVVFAELVADHLLRARPRRESLVAA